MDEENENPFMVDRPSLETFIPDLNASILSAERQRNNIISNPWDTPEDEDILKSIMEVNNNNQKKDTKIKYSSSPKYSSLSNTTNDIVENSTISTIKPKQDTIINNTQSINVNDPWAQNLSAFPKSMVSSNISENTSNSSVVSPINYTTIQTIATTNYYASEDSDVITIRIAPEKGGVVFKHVNYLIHSKLHKKTSIRRYSDFLWLSEILTKRYQFRIMLNLPPKHIGGILSLTDIPFLEKRRRGLERYINYIGNHPVMKNDEFFLMFLNKDTDLQQLKKNSDIEIKEEFYMYDLTDEQINLIPIDLEEKINNLRKALSFIIDQYRTLYISMEKICQFVESTSNEYTNIGYSLGQISEMKDYLGFDTFNFNLLNNGYARLADGFQKISSLYHEDYQNLLNGIVENLETQKEILEGFDILLQNKDIALSKINIPQLDKRIEISKEKLNILTKKEPIPEKETRKITNNLNQDQKDKNMLLRKKIFIKYCIFCEAQFLESQKFQISSMYREYVQMQIRISSMLNEEWKILSVSTSKLPMSNF